MTRAIPAKQYRDMVAPFALPPDKPRKRLTGLHPTENEIHRAIVAQLRGRAAPGVVYWHTPNDGKRSHASAKRLQAMGMRAGVSDLCFVHDGDFFALEIKSAKGRATPEQDQFKADIIAAGGCAWIVNTLDDAITVLEYWGILKRADCQRSNQKGRWTV